MHMLVSLCTGGKNQVWAVRNCSPQTPQCSNACYHNAISEPHQRHAAASETHQSAVSQLIAGALPRNHNMQQSGSVNSQGEISSVQRIPVRHDEHDLPHLCTCHCQQACVADKHTPSMHACWLH